MLNDVAPNKSVFRRQTVLSVETHSFSYKMINYWSKITSVKNRRADLRKHFDNKMFKFEAANIFTPFQIFKRFGTSSAFHWLDHFEPERWKQKTPTPTTTSQRQRRCRGNRPGKAPLVTRAEATRGLRKRWRKVEKHIRRRKVKESERKEESWRMREKGEKDTEGNLVWQRQKG